MSPSPSRFMFIIFENPSVAFGYNDLAKAFIKEFPVNEAMLPEFWGEVRRPYHTIVF